VPPRKTNISRQCRAEVTFQSSAPVSIQSQKPRNPRRAAPISSHALSTKTTRFPGTLPPPRPTPGPRCSLCRCRAVRCVPTIISHLHSRDPATMGPQNIYFPGPRFVRPSGRSEKGDRLISLRADNGPDGKRQVLTLELRGLESSESLPVRFIAFTLSRRFSGHCRGKSNFLIRGAGTPSAGCALTDDSLLRDYHRRNQPQQAPVCRSAAPESAVWPNRRF